LKHYLPVACSVATLVGCRKSDFALNALLLPLVATRQFQPSAQPFLKGQICAGRTKRTCLTGECRRRPWLHGAATTRQ
jgi:hypothetical protein